MTRKQANLLCAVVAGMSPPRTKKPTKYVYEYIVQGHYGQGWEDLTAHDTRKAARAERKVYDENEPNAHRVIFRRTLRTQENQS